VLNDLSAYLSKAHEPLIEGLRHGGQAQHMRRALTAFGSGWRGIVGVTSELMNVIAGEGSAGVSISKEWVSRSRKLAQKAAQTGVFGKRALNTQEIGRYRKIAGQLEHAEGWVDKTGHGLVLVDPQKSHDLRSTIRHERIHSAHFAGKNTKDPWWRGQVQKTGTLDQAIRKSSPWSTSTTDAIISGYKDVKGVERESETLAWGNQHNKAFFREMEGAGFKDPRKLAFNPRSLVPAAPARRGPMTALLNSLHTHLFRSSTGSSATTSLSRPLKQISGSRIARKSL
jgi:hypothetical protein